MLPKRVKPPEEDTTPAEVLYTEEWPEGKKNHIGSVTILTSIKEMEAHWHVKKCLTESDVASAQVSSGLDPYNLTQQSVRIKRSGLDP